MEKMFQRSAEQRGGKYVFTNVSDSGLKKGGGM
jgi:hypothetical protein